MAAMIDLDAAATFTPRPTPGRPATLKGGRSRTLWVDPDIWNQVPTPKSPWVRDALRAYLSNPEPLTAQPRDVSGRYLPDNEPSAFTARAGVYIEDEQWTALNTLTGRATAHLDAALRRKLGQS